MVDAVLQLAFQTIDTGSLLMSTVGRQGMRRPSAMGGVCNVFRPDAAAHGWRALTFPLAPFLSHTGRGRGNVEDWRALTFPLAPFLSHTGSGRGNVWSGLRDALYWAAFLSHAGSGRGDVGGWRESIVARARNGRRRTVRALCNIRVVDQALRSLPLASSREERGKS